MISNNISKTVVAAAILAMSGGAAHADLDVNGAVGLPLNPTANLPNGTVVQADYTDLGSAGGGSWKEYAGHVATSPSDRLEINGGLEHSRASFGLAPLDKNVDFALGAKYLITSPDKTSIKAAAGIGYDYILAKDTYGYLVGTVPLGALISGGLPAQGHIGLRYDQFSFDSLGLGKSNKASLYAGVESPVTHDGAFSVAAELQSKNNDFGAAATPYSIEVRYNPIGQNFYVGAGLARQGLTGTNGAIVKIGYKFGRNSK